MKSPIIRTMMARTPNIDPEATPKTFLGVAPKSLLLFKVHSSQESRWTLVQLLTTRRPPNLIIMQLDQIGFWKLEGWIQTMYPIPPSNQLGK